jgi:hypothetical protein
MWKPLCIGPLIRTITCQIADSVSDGLCTYVTVIMLWVSTKVGFFTFDEIEIPTKFYANFVEISMFRFSEISISMSKSESRF